jgi:putative hemolysin
MQDLKTISAPRTLAAEPSSLVDNILLEDGCYSARPINMGNANEVMAYQKLRFDHFVRDKGWVPDDSALPGRETDRYDTHAWHIAVFDTNTANSGEEVGEHQIIAYLRALPWIEGSSPAYCPKRHGLACATSMPLKSRA